MQDDRGEEWMLRARYFGNCGKMVTLHSLG
jgi:hypothetical protein